MMIFESRKRTRLVNPLGTLFVHTMLKDLATAKNLLTEINGNQTMANIVLMSTATKQLADI